MLLKCQPSKHHQPAMNEASIEIKNKHLEMLIVNLSIESINKIFGVMFSPDLSIVPGLCTKLWIRASWLRSRITVGFQAIASRCGGCLGCKTLPHSGQNHQLRAPWVYSLRQHEIELQWTEKLSERFLTPHEICFRFSHTSAQAWMNLFFAMRHHRCNIVFQITHRQPDILIHLF